MYKASWRALADYFLDDMKNSWAFNLQGRDAVS